MALGSSEAEDQDKILNPEEGFLLAFRETKPESPQCNQPLFRAALNENDSYSTLQCMRQIEVERDALSKEIDLEVRISPEYTFRQEQ